MGGDDQDLVGTDFFRGGEKERGVAAMGGVEASAEDENAHLSIILPPSERLDNERA